MLPSVFLFQIVFHPNDTPLIQIIKKLIPDSSHLTPLALLIRLSFCLFSKDIGIWRNTSKIRCFKGNCFMGPQN